MSVWVVVWAVKNRNRLSTMQVLLGPNLCPDRLPEAVHLQQTFAVIVVLVSRGFSAERKELELVRIGSLLSEQKKVSGSLQGKSHI